MKQVDAAIIGFGKGGKTLAGALASAGKTVALVERSPQMYGGICINVACIPTKSLVQAAALSAAQGGSFAQRAQRYAAAIDEKDRVTGLLRGKNYRKLADLPNVEVVDGTASFEDATHLVVRTPDGGKERIQAQQIFVNTGARPFVPPIPGVDGPRVHVSETLLDVRTLPERLVIIGGGYIGMEFASLYANFGSHVAIVQDGSAFLPREDAEIAAAVLASLEERGVRVVRGADVRRIEDDGEQAVVVAEAAEDAAVAEDAGVAGVAGAATAAEVAPDAGNPPDARTRELRLPADAVLVATGRRPNVAGLNLEAAGVKLTDRGAVRVDEHLCTTAPNVWALGDVTGGLQFTYISLDDYRIVRSDVLGDGSRTADNRGAVPYSVFLDPPFSRVGLTEQEARAAGFDVRVAKLPAAAIPKAQLLQKPTGLLKAVIDASTDRILGAHLFCEESYEMINTVKLAMDAGLPYQTLRDAVYTHPTMTEAFNDLFAAVS